MILDRKSADAGMDAKTARACDNCIRKRARWYCAADDAFLCQGCDTCVHSANPLARRHERVRLKTASLKASNEFPDHQQSSVSIPLWHNGFTRKARTPRQNKYGKKLEYVEVEESMLKLKTPLYLVPEILSDENSHDENDEQLLYRVPIFDPFVVELCNSKMEKVTDVIDLENECKSISYDCNDDSIRFHGMLPSEMELAEFAADVESMLGKGLDDESFDMEGLGLLERSFVSDTIKVEDEVDAEEVVMASSHHQRASEIDISDETFELKFDYDSPVVTGKEYNKAKVRDLVMKDDFSDVIKKKTILLSLDYEGVLTAWADKRSPWTSGERPELESDHYWPDCMETCGTTHPYRDMGMLSGHATMVDEGREARVSRYREKRQTRLFSKKIRYEVRKLNAEKRPRMKGRFVKRANFTEVPFALLNN